LDKTYCSKVCKIFVSFFLTFLLTRFILVANRSGFYVVVWRLITLDIGMVIWL
jgi:hypothetical protein